MLTYTLQKMQRACIRYNASCDALQLIMDEDLTLFAGTLWYQ
jgi:hypothetical protein